MTARVIGNLPHLHIGMIDGEIPALGEGQAEEPTGRVKRCLHDVGEHKIGFHFRFVEVVLGLPDLLGVIPPVPRLDRVVETLGAGYVLECRPFVPRLLLGRFPDL